MFLNILSNPALNKNPDYGTVMQDKNAQVLLDM